MRVNLEGTGISSRNVFPVILELDAQTVSKTVDEGEVPGNLNDVEHGRF